jgi:hypothetical protein
MSSKIYLFLKNCNVVILVLKSTLCNLRIKWIPVKNINFNLEPIYNSRKFAIVSTWIDINRRGRRYYSASSFDHINIVCPVIEVVFVHEKQSLSLPLLRFFLYWLLPYPERLVREFSTFFKRSRNTTVTGKHTILDFLEIWHSFVGISSNTDKCSILSASLP